MAPESSRPSGDRARRPKGVLFCPDCDHEGPIGGDWTVRTLAADTPEGPVRRLYACPACGTVVENRPHYR